MNLENFVAQLLEFIPTYQFQVCASIGTRAIVTSKISLAGINSCVWLSPNSPIAPVSATSKPVCARSSPNSIIWASEAESPAPRSPMPTSSRLAHLRRLRPSVDPHRRGSLPRRILRSGIVRDRVCLRFHHHRFVPVAVSLGQVSAPQKRGQAAYPAGPAGQHSDQCLCDRWPSSRRQPAGRTAARSRSVLLASTAVTWTSLASTPSLRLAPSSSLAPKRICSSTAALRIRSNGPRGCGATKPLF